MSYIKFKEHYQEFTTAINNAEATYDIIRRRTPSYDKLANNHINRVKVDIQRLQLLSNMIATAKNNIIYLSDDDFTIIQKYLGEENE